MDLPGVPHMPLKHTTIGAVDGGWQPVAQRVGAGAIRKPELARAVLHPVG
jgi:hypothetical protein